MTTQIQVDALGPVGPFDADQTLSRAGWQGVVFGSRLRRAELLRLRATWPLRSLRLHVLRNQPFEYVSSALTPFAAYAGYGLRATIGQYDDSLSDMHVGAADVVVVWMDFGRLIADPTQVASWLAERLLTLRGFTHAPVLVHDQAPAPARSDGAELNAILRTAVSAVPGVHVIDQAGIAERVGSGYLDERASAITGSRLGDAACLETARELGLRWFPAVMGAGIRAVVVDLDGTLYDGVLGEDGPMGIRIAPGHQQVAHRLLELRERGVFLALLSRNDSADIEKLLEARDDLLLRLDHFSVVSASWEPKEQGLRAIVQQLRITPNTVLVVDDNPGELAALSSDVPGIHCVWADPSDPDSTARALTWYPGLDKPIGTEADTLRLGDLAAAQSRDIERRSAPDPESYIRSLHSVITLVRNPTHQLARLHELSMKTNQFNTTLSRTPESELARRMDDPDSRVISAALRDRLSDSGVVCALMCRKDGDRLVVDELAMSCRALGRGVETPLVLAALRRVNDELGTMTVVFPFVRGPRNEPARRWLTELTGFDPVETGQAVLEWGSADVQARLAGAPMIMQWEDEA